MLVPARSDAAVAARTSRALRVASSSVEAWLLAGVVAVGAWLRFATLGAQSYWFDEAQAAHELHLSFGSMLSSMVVHETNPPLYFVLGWLWARVFGTGEVGLRSLSALLGTAVIPIAYLCGRELVSRRAGPGGGRARGAQPVHDLVLPGGPGVHAAGRALRRLAAVLRAGLARAVDAEHRAVGRCSRRWRC